MKNSYFGRGSGHRVGGVVDYLTAIIPKYNDAISLVKMQDNQSSAMPRARAPRGTNTFIVPVSTPTCSTTTSTTLALTSTAASSADVGHCPVIEIETAGDTWSKNKVLSKDEAALVKSVNLWKTYFLDQYSKTTGNKFVGGNDALCKYLTRQFVDGGQGPEIEFMMTNKGTMSRLLSGTSVVKDIKTASFLKSFTASFNREEEGELGASAELPPASSSLSNDIAQEDESEASKTT